MKLEELENIIGIMTWECCPRCDYYNEFELKCGLHLHVMQTEIVCKTFKKIVCKTFKKGE